MIITPPLIGVNRIAIRKLDTTMRERGWRDYGKPDLVAPGGGWHSGGRSGWTYSFQQARQITTEIREHAKDPRAGDVVALKRIAGLRASEATTIRGSPCWARRLGPSMSG